MWQITHISANDFMSFENLKYEFSNKCFVVRAENKDNEGQLSNGGGKTSFIDAITVALLGYSLTGRNVKDCIRWNSEDSSFFITLSMSNKKLGQVCNITRRIYSNTRGQELTILVNNVVPETLPSKKGVENGVDVKSGNKYILDSILDIKENDLLSYFLISKTHYQPFLSINTDSKLDVISRFTKSEIVDKIIGKLQVDFKAQEDSVLEYQMKISGVEGQVVAIKDSMNDESKVIFETTKKETLLRIENDITSYADKIESIINETATKNVGLVEVEKKLKVIDKEELDELVKLESELQVSLKGIRKNINDQTLLKNVIENHLAGLIECPKCSHKFSLEEECYSNEDLEDINIIISEETVKKESHIESIELIENEIIEINKVVESNRRVQREINQLKNEIEDNNKREKRLMMEIDVLENKYETESAKTFEDEKISLNSRIASKQKELIALQDQLDNVLVEMEAQKQWITNFEDFKFYLGNKPIEAICSLVNKYLNLNGSDLNLHIEGFKKLRSGELRQALQPVIYRNWSNPQSFNQFSEGEKVRLNISVDLAFQQLINQASSTGGLDMYINDELINPLDSQGVANAAKAFNQLDKTIILVSHSGADLVYQNTILIQKQNGKSVIV